MLFNSLTFLVFLFLTLVLYVLMPTWAAQKHLLLVASYLFYAAWNPPYVMILLASTTIDWWLARRISVTVVETERKVMLAMSLISNLGLLGFFKYSDFLLQQFTFALGAAGVTYQAPPLDIVLPIGISFYTFASLSYTIDVYRRELRGDWSFPDYALFVSFFPHLVAGPIMRGSYLLSQIGEARRASGDQVSWGLLLLCFGLFSKVVMADTVFGPIVELVYTNPAIYGMADTWLAVFAFSGQIYYDFSGYSLCAIGVALCFGFEFPDNFRQPYAARGFSDFWRRWHISLSSWLRDYLYIPLGGNRGGSLANYRNLFLVMLIGGLWHGASWMFVFWGGLHGLYLASERMLQRFGEKSSAVLPSGWLDLLLTLGTFLVITLTWIPFRAPSLDAMNQVLLGLYRWNVASKIEPISALISIAAVAATVILHFHLRDSSLEAEFMKVGTVVQAAAVGCCLIALFLWSGGDQRAFIYFQF